jgi:predicted NAD-dependent protein-ADP-ribosyltransferase YbiA (DUF1768 family)
MITNIVIAGSRTFDNYDLLSRIVKQVITRENITNPIIISGGARGADELGERFACDNNLHCRVFPAQWDKYGKSAGYKRNVEMANISHLCIVFWDGASKGTQHMINICCERGIKTYIIDYVFKKCTVYKGKGVSFRGDNFFLSNMYKTDICYEGITYPSVENAYQAAKTDNISDKHKISKMSPVDAKKYGRRVEMKPDFDRVAVMTALLKIKFLNEALMTKLKGTEGPLIEKNLWHDNFWGSCTCAWCGDEGQNILGKILMEIRDTKENM